MTVQLRGMPNQWDEWRPSKLNLFEGSGAQDGTTGTQGGEFFGGPESTDVSNAAFFGSPTGYDDTGVGAPGGPAGLGIGYQGGYDDTGVGAPGGSLGFADVGGPAFSDTTTGGPAFSDIGGPGPGFDNTTDASGMFGFNTDPGDIIGSTNFSTDNLGSYDVGGPGVYGNQGQNVGDMSTAGQNFSTQTFGPDPVGPTLNAMPDVVDPFDMPTQALTAFEVGQQGRGPVDAPMMNPMNVAPAQMPNTQQLGPYDDPMSTLTGFPSVAPTSPPATPDAVPAGPFGMLGEFGKGLQEALNPGPYGPLGSPQSLLDVITNAVVGPAQAQGRASQFDLEQGLIAQQAPSQSQQGLNNTFADIQAANTLAAQNNPGLANALAGFANPEETGKGMSPLGLNLDPEAPSRGPMQDQPSLSEFWGEQGRGVDRGQTMSEPHTVMTDPGRTVAEQNQPSIEEFWEGTPGSLSRSSEISNPNTSQMAPGWFTNPSELTMGTTTNWGNPNAPTAEQMAAARDAMIDKASREETQNPLTDVFARDVTDPTIFAPDPGRTMTEPHTVMTDPGRTMAEPHTQPGLPEFWGEPAPPAVGRDMEAPHNQPGLEEFWEGTPGPISRGQEQSPQQQDMEELLQEEQERQAQPDIPMPTPNPLTPAERAQQDRAPAQITVNPSRGAPGLSSRGTSGLSSRGAEARGAPSTLGRGTDRGTGRDSPGVQGLQAGLRGNDLAQALVSRGFDPNMVGAALTISDRGAMLTAMLEAAGLSHAQALATAAQARGEVAAQHGIPSGNVNSSGVARGR